ncbi:mycofactocin-associated electron transfer flavoprotein beta subunit [Saccharopolyspora sp. 6T]|uniref:mycofactocin-associated electron transfer flavoprotein beta subunit n=1 Tax=Saccharopolyspora sp. 6T TaxID=2877238 RepID=UPI001CD6D6E3|nr:mycofactocin-associated electron transfer flavoprotein beta subunit [Saccharopolyspora sp. 6T]MCA1185370.1 mycofactocin-associated electron transfer flavoprotein beta subunit [Saccharopolyspora sp. 6T]
MFVVVALRWVDERAEVDPLSGRVRTSDRSAGASAADAAALELGLRLAGFTGGRCAAVSLAPAGADELLRAALASGADEVLRVEPAGEPDPRAADSGAGTAVALAAAVRERFGAPDLVLTGDHSPDRGTGATPALLAAEFGCAQALGLVSLDTEPAADGRLRALRRLDRGRRERLAVPLPAVCSVEAAGVRPRTAALPAVLAARSAEVPVVAARATADPPPLTAAHGYRPRAKELPAPAGAEPLRRLRVLTGVGQRSDPPRVVVTDDPAEAADELLAFLRAEGHLDG